MEDDSRMEDQSARLDEKSRELATRSDGLLNLLKLAGREARNRGGQEWANLSIENIAGYRSLLTAALRAHDTKGLKYAAGEFTTLGRYVDDYDYSWFSAHQELSRALEAVHRNAVDVLALVRS